MARKDKPYLPLYVQDFMTDERLMECSAATTGVYVKIMCVLHKCEPYGKILLKQKDKQKDKQIENFALKFAKHLPFSLLEICSCISELIDEGCLTLEGDSLYQKRMFNDGNLSTTRSESGSKGGKITQVKNKDFAKAKNKANSDIDIDNETDIDIINNKNQKKTFNTKPVVSDFNGLPDKNVDGVIEKMQIAKQIKIDSETVKRFWEIFKIENLTGYEYYPNEGKVYKHFSDWLKFQKIDNGTNKQQTVGNRQSAGQEKLLAKGKELFNKLTREQSNQS